MYAKCSVHLCITIFAFVLMKTHLLILTSLGDGTQMVALSHVDDVTNIIAAAVGNDKAFKQVSHTTLHNHAQHYSIPHFSAICYIVPLCIPLLYHALHYPTPHCTAPRCTAPHCTALCYINYT